MMKIMMMKLQTKMELSGQCLHVYVYLHLKLLIKHH